MAVEKRKTLIIGLDSADWAYIEKALPNCPALKNLMDHGIKGNLRSTIPQISPVAWSSFVTGKHPCKHGIFDWQVREVGGGLKSPVTSRDRKGTPFWNYLNKGGFRTGVVGIPLTFPIEAVDGFMISGFDAPASDNYYPENLKDVLKERFSSDADIIFHHRYHDGDERAYLDFWRQYIEKLTDAVIYLTDFYDIDCLIINYMAIDHVNHSAYEFESVLECLRYLDKAISCFINAFPDANIVILSDHGAKRVKGGFLICELLYELGLITYKTNAIDPSHYMELLVRLLQGKIKLTGVFEKIIRNVIHRMLEIVPKSWVNTFWQRAYALDQRIFHAFWNIDKERSVIDLTSGCAIQFYIKDSNNHNKKELVSLIKNRLSDIEDPLTRGKLFENFYEPDYFAAGDMMNTAPDLIADFGGSPFAACLGYPMSAISEVNGLFAYKDHHYYNLLMKGTHLLYGIYLLYGHSFNHMGTGHDMDIYDIPGVALALNGIPLPDDYDSKLYPEIFKIDIICDRQKSMDQEGTSDSSKDSESYAETMEKLRSLGYIG